MLIKESTSKRWTRAPKPSRASSTRFS